MRFSNHERKDLFYAGLLISLAFAILLSGGFRAFTNFNSSFGIIFLLAFFTAGLGFLLHELAHKFVAQSYHLWAEFRAYYGGLWLAVGLSLFGFIIAAPGAVYIHGEITRERNGKISVVGPLTNIFLAVVFLILLLVLGGEGILGALFSFGLTINSLLAAFNMIPVMPFDGAKVIAWNKGIYTVTILAGIGLFILSFLL
ncbi:hypothetical protein CMI47_17500 [Candidatus Pacearchaeota archaeon]|nr:hypothetical protein [Candidatus Pacearchaeota archaeon]|tara:strand:+ start:8593 stop:9189 length:597 start_codon:yes stop_codon:yes gene_type:complete